MSEVIVLPTMQDAAEREDLDRGALERLRQAIVDNTKGDLFWIGEALLAELEKETGFRGATKSICKSCGGERVIWMMSEFPIPCPDCNPNSPEFKRK